MREHISIVEQKKQLRRLMRMEKLKLSESDIKHRSALIFNTIEKLEVFQDAQVVMAYWSMDDEVNTHNFILKWYKKKIILLPVIDGEFLRVRIFAGVQSLRKEHTLGIYEPVGEDYSLNRLIDVIIVPGIAFDANNNRLGRGKAFYDKFLSQISAYKIGVGFDFQLVNHLPADEKDVKMDRVITK